jgi:hypothetical protein
LQRTASRKRKNDEVPSQADESRGMKKTIKLNHFAAHVRTQNGIESSQLDDFTGEQKKSKILKK